MLCKKCGCFTNLFTLSKMLLFFFGLKLIQPVLSFSLYSLLFKRLIVLDEISQILVFFQPPLWERYQHQVKEWEQAVARATAVSSAGCKENLLKERPPMLAFCLKPRGLEVPNKGSKQRSQRRFPVSGHSQAVSGDQEGSHTFGV